MTENLTSFLKGPVFIFAIVFALLGVMRLAFLHLHLIVLAVYNSWKHDRRRSELIKVVLSKAVSLDFFRYKFGSSSILWILAYLVFGFLFLSTIDHVSLMERHFGLRLIAVSRPMTMLLLAFIVLLIVVRIFILSTTSKHTVGSENNLLFWFLLFAVLATGFCSSTINNIGLLHFAQFCHVFFGDILIMLIPFSRIGYWLVSPLANITCHLGVWLLPDSPKRDETAAYFHRLSEKR